MPEELEHGDKHTWEVVTDADYAGHKVDPSEALLLRHFANFAGSLSCKSNVPPEGVGSVRWIDAGIFWVQQRVRAKEFEIRSFPTAINPADIGTKPLSKARSLGLLCLIGEPVKSEARRDRREDGPAKARLGSWTKVRECHKKAKVKHEEDHAALET